MLNKELLMVGSSREPMLTVIVPDMEVGTVSVPIGEHNWNHVSGNLDGTATTELIPIRVIDQRRTIELSLQIGAGLQSSKNVTFTTNNNLKIIDYTKDALISIAWR